MILADKTTNLSELKNRARHVFECSAAKIVSLHKTWKPSAGAPVFTVAGKYASRGWTEWTHGFQFGSALLQYDATGDRQFLQIGREGTRTFMAKHLTHGGVHDHGFNIISTYGNLLRLIGEGRLGMAEEEARTCEVALKVSGAVQASRWTNLPDGLGYIYSFNGPHSLFADTIRSLRSLAVAHRLGHVLMDEGDREVNLFHRLLVHAETTRRYNVYFGRGRDAYDVRGRVAHESVFNVNDGSYRSPSTQQGYSPFTTWTRALAWILLGYAEELEFLAAMPDREFPRERKKKSVLKRFEEVATAVADYYVSESPSDGIPYWDTGAPGLAKLGDYKSRPADPFNDVEPVDSSAAAIAAQGFLRLGAYLKAKGERKRGNGYERTGLAIASVLFAEPYLSMDHRHQGLILHSVYHRPNGWDYVPKGSRIPRGESSMWGDYHARELALMVLRMGEGPSYRFWGV